MPVGAVPWCPRAKGQGERSLVEEPWFVATRRRGIQKSVPCACLAGAGSFARAETAAEREGRHARALRRRVDHEQDDPTAFKLR